MVLRLVMDAAKLSIEQSRKEAQKQLRDEVSGFSLEIAEKLLRRQMQSDGAQKELVDKLLEEVEKKN